MSNAAWFFLGVGFALAVKLIIAWAEATAMANDVRKRMEEYTPNPNPEEGLHFLEREARRVERPLEERSTVGVVYRDKR